jgi:hypothetical protein
MADKLVALIEASAPPPVEGMGEYVYPAKRAREFLQSYSSYSEYESHRLLTDLVTRYESLVKRADPARASDTWRTQVEQLRREDNELRELAVAIGRSLDDRR